MGRTCCGSGKAIFLSAFGRWHMFLGAMLIHLNSWCITGTEFDLRSHVLCSVQGIIYSKSVARKRKTIQVLVFTSSHSYFSLSLPCLFSSKMLTVCRDKTERWSVVCDEENTAYCCWLSCISKAISVITEHHLGMETPIHLESWEQG